MDQQQVLIQADQALKEVTRVVEGAPLPKAQHIYLDQCLQALRMIVGEWSKIKDDEQKAKLLKESLLADLAAKEAAADSEKKSP